MSLLDYTGVNKKKKKKKDKPEKVDYHQLRYETLSELKLIDVYGVNVIGEEEYYSPAELQFMRESEIANRERNALLAKAQPDIKVIMQQKEFDEVLRDSHENPAYDGIIGYIEWHRQLETVFDNMAFYENLFYFDEMVRNRLGLVDLNNVHEVSMLKMLEIEMQDRYYNEDDLQDDMRLPGLFDGVAGRRNVIDDLVRGI